MSELDSKSGQTRREAAVGFARIALAAIGALLWSAIAVAQVPENTVVITRQQGLTPAVGDLWSLFAEAGGGGMSGGQPTQWQWKWMVEDEQSWKDFQYGDDEDVFFAINVASGMNVKVIVTYDDNSTAEDTYDAMPQWDFTLHRNQVGNFNTPFPHPLQTQAADTSYGPIYFYIERESNPGQIHQLGQGALILAQETIWPYEGYGQPPDYPEEQWSKWEPKTVNEAFRWRPANGDIKDVKAYQEPGFDPAHFENMQDETIFFKYAQALRLRIMKQDGTFIYKLLGDPVSGENFPLVHYKINATSWAVGSGTPPTPPPGAFPP